MHIGKKILHSSNSYNVVLAIGKYEGKAPILITGVMLKEKRSDKPIWDRYLEFLRLPHLQIDKSISLTEFYNVHSFHPFTSVTWDYEKNFRVIPFKRISIDILQVNYQ